MGERRTTRPDHGGPGRLLAVPLGPNHVWGLYLATTFAPQCLRSARLNGSAGAAANGLFGADERLGQLGGGYRRRSM